MRDTNEVINAILRQERSFAFQRVTDSSKLYPESIEEPVLKSQYKQKVKASYFVDNRERLSETFCQIYQYELTPQELEQTKCGSIVIYYKVQCRICHREELTSRFIVPCLCRDEKKFVHEECLKYWMIRECDIYQVSMNTISCEVCAYKYDMRVIAEPRFKLSHASRIDRGRKICWASMLLLIVILTLTLSLLYYGYGLANQGINALLIIGLIVETLILLFTLKIIKEDNTIEYILFWHFMQTEKFDLTQYQSENRTVPFLNSVSASQSGTKRHKSVQKERNWLNKESSTVSQLIEIPTIDTQNQSMSMQNMMPQSQEITRSPHKIKVQLSNIVESEG